MAELAGMNLVAENATIKTGLETNHH
jgi:hypothetical protein